MTAPGRNDPCPCGSGKKFKRCCGALAVVPSGYTEADHESGVKELARFSRREEFDRDRARAEALFWGAPADELEPELEELLEHTNVLINFHNFFTIDFEIEPGRTLLELFLERRGSSLAPGARRFLEDLAGSHVGVYEVLEARPGEGLQLADLLLEGELWVDEVFGSAELCRQDVIAARLLQTASGAHVLEGDLYAFPPAFKARLLEQLGEVLGTAGSDGGTPPPKALLKRTSRHLHRLWLEAGSLAAPSQFGTFDGEALEPTLLRFAIEDSPRLVRALNACEDLEDQGQGTWVWLREMDGDDHVVGWLLVDRDELVVETLAQSHGREARALIERIAGDAVRHLATESDDPEDYLSEGPLHEYELDEHLAAPPPAEASALVALAIESHYRRWLDDEIPALGGATPRAAAADPALRPRLVELLKQMEDHEERHPSSAAGRYDFGRVRRALGLD